MIEFQIEKFWCCLADAERGAFRLVQAQYEPILPFVLKTLFDAYWNVFGHPSATIRREIFVASYGLTEAQITPEGSPEITVYLMDRELWALIAEFVREGESDCPEPCFQRRYSE